MKVALVYDRVNKWGGAERVLLALHELFPNAPLYTSVYSKELAPWADVFDVRPSFLQTLPYAKSSHEYFALLMPLAFEQFVFDEFDLVISVTSEAAKGIVTKPQTKHLCYMLTPTRYLWSGYDEYFQSKLSKMLSYPAITYLRMWDKVASQRPDHIVSISQEVQKRVKTYYQKASDVIYPPLPFAETISYSKKKGEYFLIVSRLVRYKRVDLAIKACNILKKELVIVGKGAEIRALKSIAGPTIRFVGSLTDEELGSYYRNCKALIFPGREDFGLTILEAQLYGKPVIAYKAGGAVETVKAGKTGLFFTPQTIKALTRAIVSFERRKFSPKVCHNQATLFSKRIFLESFTKAVNDIMK